MDIKGKYKKYRIDRTYNKIYEYSLECGGYIFIANILNKHLSDRKLIEALENLRDWEKTYYEQ